MELNEQKAKDIDDILQFSVAHGFLKGFDVRYYKRKIKPDWETSYLYHLAGLVDHYMKNMTVVG